MQSSAGRFARLDEQVLVGQQHAGACVSRDELCLHQAQRVGDGIKPAADSAPNLKIIDGHDLRIDLFADREQVLEPNSRWRPSRDRGRDHQPAFPRKRHQAEPRSTYIDLPIATFALADILLQHDPLRYEEVPYSPDVISAWLALNEANVTSVRA